MDRIQQYAGTIMQALIIGLLGWFGIGMVELQKDVAVLNAEVTAVKTTLVQGTNDRYRGSDAARDFAAINTRIDRNDRRIDHLEDVLNGRGPR